MEIELMMNHHDNVWDQGDFCWSVLIRNRVPVALAHLDLQIQIKKEFLLFPLFVLVLQQLKFKLLSRVINKSNSSVVRWQAGWEPWVFLQPLG